MSKSPVYKSCAKHACDRHHAEFVGIAFALCFAFGLAACGPRMADSNNRQVGTTERPDTESSGAREAEYEHGDLELLARLEGAGETQIPENDGRRMNEISAALADAYRGWNPAMSRRYDEYGVGLPAVMAPLSEAEVQLVADARRVGEAVRCVRALTAMPVAEPLIAVCRNLLGDQQQGLSDSSDLAQTLADALGFACDVPFPTGGAELDSYTRAPGTPEDDRIERCGDEQYLLPRVEGVVPLQTPEAYVAATLLLRASGVQHAAADRLLRDEAAYPSDARALMEAAVSYLRSARVPVPMGSAYYRRIGRVRTPEFSSTPSGAAALSHAVDYTLVAGAIEVDSGVVRWIEAPRLMLNETGRSLRWGTRPESMPGNGIPLGERQHRDVNSWPINAIELLAHREERESHRTTASVAVDEGMFLLLANAEAYFRAVQVGICAGREIAGSSVSLVAMTEGEVPAVVPLQVVDRAVSLPEAAYFGVQEDGLLGRLPGGEEHAFPFTSGNVYAEALSWISEKAPDAPVIVAPQDDVELAIVANLAWTLAWGDPEQAENDRVTLRNAVPEGDARLVGLGLVCGD